MSAAKSCIFCRIVEGAIPASKVLEDEHTIAFLDHSPLFHGHVLLVPKAHHQTLADLPPELLQPFFAHAQRLTRAVQAAMKAEGTFVAVNNIVSQSVPHLHLHVVPRKKGDGLRGFFWPRTRYTSDEQRESIARAIADVLRAP